tara:strand:- start:142 stop:558 length:417 start_codon:yes stop_codon:yes gene_type:complete
MGSGKSGHESNPFGESSIQIGSIHDSMGRENQNKNNGPASDQNTTSLIRSMEDISVRHGRRLRRWLSTWDAVDHSLLVRLSSHIRESQEASRLVPDMIPVLDEIQYSSEMDITTAVERIEHIINLCQRASSPNQSDDS